MNYIFSLAFMANSFSMTGLLIMLSLAGNSVLAAEVGIVQAATLALFYAFSGNTRNLILNHKSGVTVQSVLNNRLVLLLPLVMAAYWLSVVIANVPSFIAIGLILRRAVEWFDEIYLSEMERLDVKKTAFEYIILQAVLLIISLLWLILKLPFLLFGLLLWALLPLFLSFRFYCQNLPTLSILLKQGVSKKMLPHIGSSMIIGVTVYVFRLLIVMVTGKSIAGDLFTAFAIGGVLGSVFANAIGPSLALHQKRSLNYQIPTIVKSLLTLFLGTGLLLVTFSILKLDALRLTGKTFLFWQATGLSMVAGTVMVFAQMIRHRLLQHHQEQDLFGPDVMMNILIIAAVPFGYYLFGLQMMTTLYLLSAVLAYLFYASYEYGEGFKSGISSDKVRLLKIVLVAMLLIPLFFQMHGGIFNDKAIVFDSKGGLSMLPIPLSVLGCFLGVLLLGSYQQAKQSFTFIFTTFILMVFATIITTGQQALLEESKFIFLIQFVMPMFGLVFGQFFYRQEDSYANLDFEKTLFFVLLIFVPLQVACTWLQGGYYLSPYLYFMSVYQHLQYVPVVLVSAYLLALVGLWVMPKYRVYLVALMMLMSVYVVASLSMLAISMFYIGIFSFVWFQNKKFSYGFLRIAVFTCLLISSFYYLTLIRPNMPEGPTLLQSNQLQAATEMQPSYSSVLPVKILESRFCWQYYYGGVTEGIQSFLFGHAERPSRDQSPSAQNYYLDLVYNFGILAIAPLISLIFYTVIQVVHIIKKAGYIDKRDPLMFFSLSGIVLFLLLADNFLKVSLRQPYSGIFTFFLWGLLLNKLAFLQVKGSDAIQV